MTTLQTWFAEARGRGLGKISSLAHLVRGETDPVYNTNSFAEARESLRQMLGRARVAQPPRIVLAVSR
jgi:hypothetical protein